MVQRLFHRTTLDAIPSILSRGFKDREDGHVWFSAMLDDWGATGLLPVEVTLVMSDEELAAFAVQAEAGEELDDAGEWAPSPPGEIERFTWYKIPASIVDATATARVMTPEEVRRFHLGLDGRWDAPHEA